MDNNPISEKDMAVGFAFVAGQEAAWREVERLRALNAELVKALVKITDIISAAGGRTKLPICLQIDEVARAALAKART